ncbi:hypothetical protein JK628_08060 [Shewanella sp. KX20019]|nr:hypothetical protein [Shewanella sp. KX20019]QQX81776.1 hypothetical protein JK628_08060 [Shewanella sp. KX20019]
MSDALRCEQIDPVGFVTDISIGIKFAVQLTSVKDWTQGEWNLKQV